MKRLDLKYAKHHAGFFSQMHSIKASLAKNNRDHLVQRIDDFNKQDHIEVSRGKGYAVFDEIRQSDGPVTIDALKQAFEARGILDEAFQAKVLSLILQTRLALPFGLANPILFMTMEQNLPLSLNNDNYKLDVAALSSHEVTLSVSMHLRDFERQEDALETRAIIRITPNEVVLEHFYVTLQSDSVTAETAYQLFLDNQQTIFQKILTFIRHLFGFKDELVLDRSSATPSSIEEDEQALSSASSAIRGC